MTTTIIQGAFVLVAYLLGAIPMGLILTRLKGIDIRKVGSGNIGATNVFRSVSKGLGIATFVFDFLKGLVPAAAFPLLARRIGLAPGDLLGILCGCAAIAGHNWPVYIGFKGGKGVATSAGVLLGIAPAAVGIGLAAWILLFVTSRYVSIASIGAAVIVPLSSWIMNARDGFLLPITLTLLGALVILRHRSNIQRLMDGTEHRFSFRRQRSEVGGQKAEKIQDQSSNNGEQACR
ncbi:MAG: glycerol-3-phosphate 1-O-acyltransferase PlsY [Kiritimatiellae bacterium]|nr:glycerol-3-phosphate 1-O-acyltransferase PlsY [Kiritimatiellia bacterium]